MEVAIKLREARGLIEKGWTQGAAARQADGRRYWGSLNGPQVASYCIVGAASCVTWDTPIHCEGSPFTEVLDALTGALADLWEVEKSEYDPPWDAVETLQKWNDSPGRSKNEVVRLYTRAIQLVEA